MSAHRAPARQTSRAQVIAHRAVVIACALAVLAMLLAIGLAGAPRAHASGVRSPLPVLVTHPPTTSVLPGGGTHLGTRSPLPGLVCIRVERRHGRIVCTLWARPRCTPTVCIA